MAININKLIPDILNVHENFFGLFTPTTGFPITGAQGISNFTVPVFYGSEGSEGFVGVHKENYPQIIIQDFAPEIADTWQQVYLENIGGFFEVNGIKKAYRFFEPIRLKFSYDVTIYCRDPFQKMLIQSEFIKKFVACKKVWFFNGEVITSTQEDAQLGFPISYKLVTNDNYREDGINEINYNFTFEAMVFYQDPIEVTLVQEFNLTLNGVYSTIVAGSGIGTGQVAIPTIVVGDRNITYTQDVPQFLWTFSHNLGFKPSINVYDADGNEVVGYTREDTTLNQVKIGFGLPMTGTIIAS